MLKAIALLFLSSLLSSDPSQQTSLPSLRIPKILQKNDPKSEELDRGVLKAIEELIDLLEDAIKQMEGILKDLEVKKGDPKKLAGFRRLIDEHHAELKKLYEFRDQLRKKIDK